MTTQEKVPEYTIPRIVTSLSTVLQVVHYSTDTRRAPQVEREIPIPFSVIERYAQAATRMAHIEELEEGDLYASIPGFVGVWATADTRDALLAELGSVVEDWATLKVIDGDDDIPVVADIDLRRFSS